MAIQLRQFVLSALTTALNLQSDNIVATLHTTSMAPNYDTWSRVSQLTNELPAGNGYTAGGQVLTNKTTAYLPANTWGLTWAASTAYTAGQMVQVGSTGIYRCITAGTSGSAAPTWPTTVGSTVTDGGATWECEGYGTGQTLPWVASTAFPVGWVVRPAPGNGYLYRASVAGTTSSAAPTWPTTVGTTVTDGGVTWECIGSGVVAFQADNPSWPGATFTSVRYVVLSDRTPSGASNQQLIAIVDYGSGQSGQGGAFTVQFNPEGLVFFFTP